MILDGSDSKDKDGKLKLYQWQQITGSKVVLDNANDIKASFISPLVTHDTILAFKLSVRDDKGGLDTAITTVKVVNNEPRSANIPDMPASDLEDNAASEGNMINSTAQ